MGAKWIFVVGAVVGVLACEEPTPTSTTPTSTAKPMATASATATASAAPKPDSSASAKAGNMTHCPSSVQGATTEIKDTPDGVEIIVKATDPAAVTDIRARSKHLVDASKAQANAPKHTGTGEGGGQFGRCPVVMKDTTVDAKDVDGGSSISVKATDAKEVDWLRREAKERKAELADPGAKDAGQRKMAHCPSAVAGATTQVKAGKDAIEVTVTAKDDAATKEIRERTKHLAEAAKADPTGVKHTGEGMGGGGLGRCPIVMKDTSIDTKDAPGGSVVTVKPAKPADLAALTKEIEERAHPFEAPAAK